ncbi:MULTISPECIES: glycoside hydrolase family 19 protein [unclassified Sphingomonas]|uniref:glycoside hydrolase family 19 protein n=1 Tax=unclassified Sphingomonas TaxID=196159 RepID=UPI00092939E6|nr:MULTISPECIES: glycoside hydrolase family 19 protein [unclassified Sphingomonas]MBN8849931.1 glycoside hydrolase family 19 protein [Sphingomonas sp.]OJV28610.1 MAG: chitinase [Sphingomonas sp. 67-36]
MLDVAKVQRRLGVPADGALGPITLGAIFMRCGATPAIAQHLASTGVAALEGAVILESGLRLAHFLAEVGHESMGFARFTEIWGPTPQQVKYEGRADLGNVNPGDGYRYRGRGPIQITGRANYRRYGEMLGIDLEGNPDLAASPAVGIRIAAAYWTRNRINAPADRDDIEAVTRLINGGLNGIVDRRARLAKAKELLL